MKASHVALLALAGMVLSSATVYSLTPPGGASAAITADPSRNDDDSTSIESVSGDAVGEVELAHFTAGSTVMIEGRMGHPKVIRNPRGETFVMLEARATSTERARRAAPVNLSIVIDKSGSMKGSRLRNAVQAAVGAVERLQDGDMVSVVAFDTRMQLVAPLVTIGPSTRGSVIAAIRGIQLGGDTCISCGIEGGMDELARATEGRVSRMLVLSDGDANHGLRDVPGFRSLAQRAQTRGISISTIGVDVDYNEKILSAIAVESNGRHYFVENDAGLARVFESEAESLTQAIASGAEVDIELGQGVELDRVFDRSFRRSGNRVTVPLGTFSSGDVKTVLLKVRLPSDSEGALPVASIEMKYRDLVKDEEGRCSGKLGVEVVSSGASDLDAVVAGRVNRSETAAALKEANLLFQQGRVQEAERKLAERQQALLDTASKAKTAAPAARASDVANDFEKQIAATEEARTGFAEPPPPVAATPIAGGFAQAPAAAAPAPTESRKARSTVRRNEANASDFGF
ncbi:vWA domain-containing protein [Polyangium aurulentum]|uniref:vWA domain-containing protein n=1 Tax=Polyangium aurulentum TaxID=2567896 RepID=UPI0010AE4A6E|nr:VWA domain-containing protein [Polyangium aurulentum]UQA58115.1 VWA domain-containing protein [Polyangium aurulentum]